MERSLESKKNREEVSLRDAPAFNDSFGIPDETSHEKNPEQNII